MLKDILQSLLANPKSASHEDADGVIYEWHPERNSFAVLRRYRGITRQEQTRISGVLRVLGKNGKPVSVVRKTKNAGTLRGYAWTFGRKREPVPEMGVLL